MSLPSPDPAANVRWSGIAAPLAAFMLLACASQSSPPASPPAPPPPGPSTIALSVVFPLTDLRAALESDIPRRMEKTSGYEISPDGRFGMQYVVERDPVSLSARDEAIGVSIRFRYGVRACYRTNVGGREAFWPCVSCGIGGEQLREATVTLDSILQWDSALFVRSNTAPAKVVFVDRCRVSGLRLDVTEWQVRPFIESQMATAAAEIDSRVRASTAIGDELSAIWRSMQEPQSLGPGSWLVLRPEGLRFGAFKGDASALRTTVTLIASPRVVIGPKPPTSHAAMPRPTIGADAEPRLRVAFTVELPFAEATKLLARNTSEPFTIERAEHGGIVLTSGRYRITGTPQIDHAASRVILPDLEYRVRGGSRFADWFRHGATRANLRRRATFDLGPTLDRFRRGVEEALRGRGIEARIASIDPVAIQTLQDRFVVTAVTTGTAEMKFTPER